MTIPSPEGIGLVLDHPLLLLSMLGIVMTGLVVIAALFRGQSIRIYRRMRNGHEWRIELDPPAKQWEPIKDLDVEVWKTLKLTGTSPDEDEAPGNPKG